MATWHLEKPKIPASGAALSVLALSVPVAASALLPEQSVELEALVWLSALIPAFLLAYYRGWQGVALGFAMAMVVLTATQLVILTAGVGLPDWPLMLAIMGMFITISLLLGGVVDRLHEAREKAEELALYDVLTGLPNRRYLELMIEKDFAAARRGIPLVVVAFDLDHFKEYNDRRGHAAGDELLTAFGEVLHTHTRRMNLTARVGGEEFISLVANSSVEGALVFVDRVREGLRVAIGDRDAPTVSVGVAAYEPEMEGSDDLVAAADQALYQAKEAGRDRVVVARPPNARREAVGSGRRG